MKNIWIIVRALFLFLSIKILTVGTLTLLGTQYPNWVSFLVHASAPNSEELLVHINNISTFVSSLIIGLVLIWWNPLKKFNTQDNWRSLSPSILIIALVVGGLGILLNSFVLSFAIDEYNNAVELSKKILSSGWIGISAVVILVPIIEEVIFRRICISTLRQEVSAPLAILLSAFLFGILHIQPAQILGATMLGVVFGTIYVLSKSILPSIILHILNNGLYIIRLMNPDDTQTDFMQYHGLQFWGCFALTAILFGGATWLLYKKYKTLK